MDACSVGQPRCQRSARKKIPPTYRGCSCAVSTSTPYGRSAMTAWRQNRGRKGMICCSSPTRSRSRRCVEPMRPGSRGVRRRRGQEYLGRPPRPRIARALGMAPCRRGCRLLRRIHLDRGRRRREDGRAPASQSLPYLELPDRTALAVCYSGLAGSSGSEMRLSPEPPGRVRPTFPSSIVMPARAARIAAP